jgi:fibronectin type 3 domain-containing protein
LAFAPSSAGTANGSLLLKDSGGATLLNIAMSGSGVSPSTHSVDLSWQASTSNVAGYRVYRGSVSGGPYSLLSSSVVPTTTFRDGTVLGGYTYYYVVTAIDSSNIESGYSNEAVATIPAP